MQTSKNLNTIFDDDFEITYEEDYPVTYPPDSDSVDVIPPTRKSRPDRRVTDRMPPVREGDYEDPYGRTDRIPPVEKVVVRKKRSHYGTKTIFKNARSIIRAVSAMISASLFFILGYEFWRGSAPYGNFATALTEQNYTLLTYFGVAAIFMLYAFCAFFQSLSKSRIREGNKVYKVDTGRGMSSYIFIYVSSYISFLVCSYLPDIILQESYDYLNGALAALNVYGSMHNMLLGLCLAGVISCLARKHMN